MPWQHQIDRMDLRHLRTFVAVADHGTVSKASVRLGVAQPALSRQIQDLERELGVKLFDRIRRRLVLTSEGQLLLDDCGGVLAAVSSLRERAKLLRRPDAGILNVAATPQTIDGVLSGFLKRYSRLRPNVRVILSESFGSELLGLVERGEVHLVVSTRGAIQASDHPLDTIWLPSLEFVAACTPSIELDAVNTLDVRQLGSHPLLLLHTSFAVRVAFDAACRIAEFMPNVSFESRAPHTLLALAEAGQGIAIVPSVLPTHRYKLRTLHLTYRGKRLREGYGIVRDRRRSLPPAADDFCHSLAAYARENLAMPQTPVRTELISRRPKANPKNA